MTDLEISLIAAGGTLIVAVVIYNKWQEYKARKSVDQAFSNGHEDVLMHPEELAESAQPEFRTRQEPRLDEVLPAEPPMAPRADATETPGIEPSAPPSGEEHDEVKLPAPRELPIDELIDCVIPLEFDTPLRGEKILSEIQALRYVGKKPVHFTGLREDGQQDVIAHGGAYTSLFAGVQLVSRSGPLNELEYSEFVMKLRAIADKLNAHPDIPDMNKVMIGARDLHQFVSEHDAQLSVNVLSNGAPWAINTLLAALEKQGFDVRPDGRLVMPDGDGGNLFSLSTNVGLTEGVTKRLTLLLDVPCVSPSRDGFGAMAACAKSLAVRLGGTVVDDGNQPISKPALDEIAEQVQAFYGAMEEAQIPAGSVRAQRLFS